MTDLEAVKAVAEIASPLTSLIVDTWLKPKLAAVIKAHREDKSVVDGAFATKFDEYLQRSLERYSYLTTVVFQNQRKKLADLYIPLTIKAPERRQSIKLNAFPTSVIPPGARVLITDTAGMGKSTALRFLFLSCIRQNIGIPIFVELRQLMMDRTILDVMRREIAPIGEDIDEAFLLRLLRRGDFVFFLDGYDEIVYEDRDEITTQLQQFISKTRQNRFILSSRPEIPLASFADFRGYSIQPLEKKEAFALIRRYDTDGSIAEPLIEKLGQPAYTNIQPFLTNPLLVSLLFKSYQFKPIVPLRKSIFYRQVYDSLFEMHDLTKGGAYVRAKRSGLDIEDFHRVLRVLGYLTVTMGKVEYSKDEILKHIADARARCPNSDFKEADFLHDLSHAVPLFVHDGDQFRWSHKSLQEYFAAQFICVDTKSSQEVILRRIYESSSIRRFTNVLDLCYDIDFTTFRNTLLRRVATEYLDFVSSSYKWATECGITEANILQRQEVTFARALTLIRGPRFSSSRRPRSSAARGRVRFDWVDKLLRDRVPEDHPEHIMFLAEDILVTVGTTSPAQVLCQILALKGDDLVIAPTTHVPSDASSTRSRPKRRRVSFRRLLRNNQSAVLNDDQGSPLNTKQNFAMATQVASLLHTPRLDATKCRELQSAVDESLLRGDEDFLIGRL